MPRGWKDWVRGLAIWGVGPDEELRLIRTDERGYLQVVQMPHAVTHQDGGSDEINVQGLSGVLADLQRGKFSFVGNYADFPAPGEPERLAFAVDRLTIYRDTGTEWQKVATAHWDYIEGVPSSFPPAGHASTHEEGGADALTPANIGANWNKLVNKPSTFPPCAHAASHQAGGADEINVNGLSGQLADYQKSRWDLVDGKPSTFPPSAHASSHVPGGSDALPTAAPAAITEGATGAEGSSTAYARADHVHETPSEWTPKEHGNEKHNPDFLAVDGSNVMRDTLSGLYNDELMALEGFTCAMRPDPMYETVLLPVQNELAFLVERGGSVAFTPEKDPSLAKRLFNGKPDFIQWDNPSGTIQVEVTFPSALTYVTFIGIYSNGECFAKDFTLEVYDNNSGQWITLAEKTNWGKTYYGIRYYSGATPISKLRFTATAYQSSSAYRLAQIVVSTINTPMLNTALSRDGGDVYGDIDMHGNDIVNPGLVDGVDVSSHAARHWDGGADELSVGKLEGTWGGATQIFYGSAPKSWTDLNLSSYVGARRALVFLKLKNHGTVNETYVFRTNGDTDDYRVSDDRSQCSGCNIGSGYCGTVMVTTDTGGRVEWKSYGGLTTTVWLLGYIALS